MAPDRSKAGGNRNRPDVLADDRANLRVHLEHHGIASQQGVVRIIGASSIGDLADVDTTTDAPEVSQGLIWNGTSWVPGSGGGSVLIEVRNESLTSIPRNSAVYVSGTATSGKPLVDLAIADGTTPLMPCIGLTQDEIPYPGDGLVIAAGQADGLTLPDPPYSDGDALYVSTTVAGALTNTRPTGLTEPVQKVALVTKTGSGSSGSVIVMGAGRVNDIPNALGDVTALGLTASAERLIGNAQVTDGGVEEISLDATLEFDPSGVTLGIAGKSLGASQISDGAITDALLASGGQYHGAYNTEAETQRSGATATTEIYYTARPDGDGYAESEVDDSSVPVGDTVIRELYFHDEFDADPDGAGWTAYTTQPANNETFANAKAALLAGLNDTNGTANTRGTLPLSLKMERAVVTNLLLNDYPGAEAAYSLRKLDRNYTGNAIRIREDSGNTETDIGFTTGGDLDTAAIASHCGANNGYVVTFYDQSGNSNDLTNSTAANQPRIYNGTTHATLGSRAAIEWVNGQNYWLDCTFASLLSQPATYFAAARYNGVSGQQEYLFDGVDATNRQALLHHSGTDKWFPFAGATNYGSVDTTAGLRLLVCLFDGSSSVFRKNGTQDAAGNFGSNSSSGISLGTAYVTGSDFNWDDVIAEFIVYGSDQSSNFSGIESNINTYYSIY